MRIILATSNLHKREEIRKILPEEEIVLAADAGFDMDFEETGQTYFENAYGKALHIYRQGGSPVLADDSGLSVVALDGAPGLYSNRFGSENAGRLLSDREKYELILEKMKTTSDRTAFFVSSMVLLFSDYRFYAAQETLAGTITQQPAGTGGFGYDPIFYLAEAGKTVAELPSEEKNRISHRAKAGQSIAAFLANKTIKEYPK